MKRGASRGVRGGKVVRGVARGRGGSCSVKQYRITATWHSKLPGGTRVYRG